MPHKGKRAQTQLNMKKLGVILINGSVTISDPCYEPHIWCAAVMNVMPGQWVCLAERLSENLIGALRICKPGCESVIPDEDYCSVAVDSGQCGFFDTAYYEEKHPAAFVDDSEVSKKWYDEVCKITSQQKCGLTSNSFGVVASSGFGEGVYPVYIGREAHGDIVAIEIRFIG